MFRPAGECLEWSDHCHATTSGPTAFTWATLRARAKPLVLAGKRPPVSGLNQVELCIIHSKGPFLEVKGILRSRNQNQA